MAKSESVGGRGGPPPPIKKNSSGLPTASSAARAGVGPCCPGRPRYEVAIRAIAHTQHAISRAVAQLATHGLLPAAAMASLRSISLRLHFVAWRRTAGATSWPGARGFGSREDIGTCQADSTSARRTWALPARVIPPLDEVSPLECSEGASPHHEANDGALGNRAGSPISQASRNAVATSTPFTHLSASTAGFHSGRPADSATLLASASRASSQRRTQSR